MVRFLACGTWGELFVSCLFIVVAGIPIVGATVGVVFGIFVTRTIVFEHFRVSPDLLMR